MLRHLISHFSPSTRNRTEEATAIRNEFIAERRAAAEEERRSLEGMRPQWIRPRAQNHGQDPRRIYIFYFLLPADAYKSDIWPKLPYYHLFFLGLPTLRPSNFLRSFSLIIQSRPIF